MSRTGSTRHLLAAFAALLMVVLSLGLAPAYADDSGTAPKSSGDTSQPQPESRADQNDGGANGQCPDGPYCSTRDGSPSENGNGDGEAKGKPCAGCVGKADNKNPHGQMPDGSDANKGYECDDNNGVGKSNPAHTGCTSDDEGGMMLLSKKSTKKTSKKTFTNTFTKKTSTKTTTSRPNGAEVLGVEASRTRASSDAAPDSANRAAPALAPSAAALPNTGAGSHLGLMLGAGLALLAAGAAALVARGRLARR